MARGFGSTLGVGTTDKIVSQLTTTKTTGFRNYAIRARRNGDGGGALGYMFSQITTSVANVLFQRVATSGNDRYQVSIIRATTPGVYWFTAPATGGWHSYFISVNFDALDDPDIAVDVWEDGVQVGINRDDPGSGAFVSSSQNFVIGNRANDDARVWDGELAEFGVWDRRLNVDERKAVTIRYSPELFRNSLVEYIPMIRDNVSRRLGPPTITGTQVTPHARVVYAG